MTILPKCAPEAMCRYAACASSKANTLSSTGLRPFPAIARFMASNICIEPTEMPCTLARRAKISPGLSSVAGPLRPPIILILPPTRIAPNEAGKRRGTADLDNMVNAAAAGEPQRSLLPVRRGLVINAVIGTDCLRTRDLVIARRCNDHLNSHRARELEAEDRDAASPQQQHCLTGDQLCVLHHRVPSGDACTGEGCTLLQRQMPWNFYDPVLLQHRIFRKHAVDAASKRACVDIGRRLAAGPALKETPGNAVADLHAGHTGADLDDFPRAIR